MDFDLIFHKEVIEKQKLNQILTPINLGNGELENVIISDLRIALDICYVNIDDSVILKEKLLDYLDDYPLELRSSKIPTKKNTVKQLKRQIKNLEKQYPNLDIDDDSDEVIINEINNLNWKLEQEKFIFYYLKEQKVFIRNWVSEKRKEFTEQPLKNWIEKERSRIETKRLIKREVTQIPKPHLDYVELGSLFAKDYIKKDKGIFYFKQKPFDKLVDISEYIKQSILTKKVKYIRQYIGDTLNEKGQKNFFKSKKMMENIIEYCKSNNIDITPEFQSKYDTLNF